VTPPSMRKSLPVMNAPSAPMSRAPTVPTIRRSGPTGRTQIDHALITRASRARQFVLGERRDDDARTDGVHTRTAFKPGRRHLQNAGLIQMGRGRIQIVNLEGLRAVACDCYDRIERGYEELLGSLD
jgi:hypothetical protein